MNVIIQDSLLSMTLDILFVKEIDGKRFIAKPIKLDFKEHKTGELINPTLKLDHRDGQEFLKAMAVVLDKSGVKTENTHKIEGTLEATNKHLEDMRSLVFNHPLEKGERDENR